MQTISLDIECTKIPKHLPWVEGAFIVSLGIADQLGDKQIWVFNHDECPGVAQADLIRQIQTKINTVKRIVGHNLKFDLLWLRHLGIDYSHCKLWCTQVAEYIINGQQRIGYSMNKCCERRGITQKIDQVKVMWEAGYDTFEIPLHILNPYLEQDCINTLTLYQQQVKDVDRLKLHKLIAVQMEMVGILSSLEFVGMHTDVEKMKYFIADLSGQLTKCETELKSLLGVDVNLSSGEELSAALFGGVLRSVESMPYVDTKLVTIKEPYVFVYKSGREIIKHRNKTMPMLIVRTRKTKCETTIPGAGFKPAPGTNLDKEGYWQTNKDALDQMVCKTKVHKQIKALLGVQSQVAKALETLVGKKGNKGLITKVRSGNLIHTNFNQTIAATGRLTSSDPNLQNQARKKTSPIKKIFVPRHPGWVIGNADLSQLEWRVAACLSNDRVAIYDIVHDRDYHRDNAIKFFGADPSLGNDHPDFEPHRTNAKVLGFRLLYGGTEYGMYYDSKMPSKSLKEWKEIVSAYWEKYIGIKKWQDGNINTVNRDGLLRGPSGRIYYFPPGKRGERYLDQAIKNYPVQGFATGDIVPLAMCAIFKKMQTARLNAIMMCQVHDSIVFDLPMEEVQPLARICIETFEDLPRLIKQFWGYDFHVPLTGEFEYGSSYGDLAHKIKL